MKRFAKQTALVTGAASGIGRATALLLAQEGATVLVSDLDTAGIAETAAAITDAGGVAFGHKLDVTSEEDWDTVVESIEKQFGRLHVLVNCAGIALVKPVAFTSTAEWQRVMAVNLDGVFFGTRAAIRSMRTRGGGSIVNVSSASGLKATPSSSAYCASKAAVLMFTKAVAAECAQDDSGVRVNAVAPGGVKTPLWNKTPGATVVVESEVWNAPFDAPLGKRFAEPLEIAQAIAFLASAEASYITGSVLTVDGGYSV